jgi:hypothetical protein
MKSRLDAEANGNTAIQVIIATYIMTVIPSSLLAHHHPDFEVWSKVEI